VFVIVVFSRQKMARSLIACQRKNEVWETKKSQLNFWHELSPLLTFLMALFCSYHRLNFPAEFLLRLEYSPKLQLTGIFFCKVSNAFETAFVAFLLRVSTTRALPLLRKTSLHSTEST
jgi:hypothetical protein